MLPIFTAQGISLALNIGKSQALKYIKKQIDAKILQKVQNQVELEINQFINTIKKRTALYLLIAVLNIFSIIINYFYPGNTILVYIALAISIIFLCYMSYQSIRNFTKFINYFQNFEQHIKSILASEIESAKKENWKNKLALLINSKEVHDYYLFVLDKIVATTSSWIKINKSLLYLRLGLFIVASFCLTYSARELFAL